MSDIQGYEPGRGRTFTPSSTAQFTEDFNALLRSLNTYGKKVSRNELTEELITTGLRYPNRFVDNPKMLHISCSSLTDEQFELLNSPQGQQIILNLLQAMVGMSGAFPFVQSIETTKEVSTTTQPDSVIEAAIAEPGRVYRELHVEPVRVTKTSKIDNTQENTQPTKETRQEDVQDLKKESTEGRLSPLELLRRQRQGIVPSKRD
jgi:hypothetical protein